MCISGREDSSCANEPPHVYASMKPEPKVVEKTTYRPEPQPVYQPKRIENPRIPSRHRQPIAACRASCGLVIGSYAGVWLLVDCSAGS